MDANLAYDPTQVAVVGASNGGRGAFFAALSQPDRFAAIMGLPGHYQGSASEAPTLAHMPVKLWVGEHDTPWIAAAEQTVETLTAAGVHVESTVVPGQGHVLLLAPGDLMDWIDQVLGR